jgi:hypothetical protein
MKNNNQDISSENTDYIKIKIKLKEKKATFILDSEDESTDEFAHFYFLNEKGDSNVVFDAVLYTLQMEYNSELYGVAEQKAAEKFPDFKKLTADSRSNDEEKEEEEELGLFMAEIMMDLEEQDEIKVKEHVDEDRELEDVILLDVGLNLDIINSTAIESFIKNYNSGTIELDLTYYSFQFEE